MWESNYIIKLELGKGIIQAANSSDTRTLIERILNFTPDDDAQLILDGIKDIREELSSKNIILPSIRIVENTSIQENEFICYWGIEKGHYSISKLDDLFNFVRDKAVEYGKQESKQAIRKLLVDALESMRRNDYQIAYECYLKVYYFAKMKGYFYECAQALTEVSCIIASTGQVELAIQYSLKAVDFSQMHNVVDNTLKCQICLNAGSIYKGYDANYAIALFSEGGNIACSISNSYLFLISQLGLAEIYATRGNISYAIAIYDNALRLVEHTNNEIALAIQREMIVLYRHLLTIKEGNVSDTNLTKQFGKLLTKIAVNIGSSLFQAAVFKCLNIPGGIALFSIGEKFLVKDNIFNGIVVMGDNNNLN